MMQPQAQDASGGGGPGAGRGEKAPPRSLQRKAALPTLRLWPPDLGEQSSVLLISGWSSVIGPSRSPQGVLASRRPKALRTGCRPSGKGRRLLPLLLSGCGVREGHQACLRGAVPCLGPAAREQRELFSHSGQKQILQPLGQQFWGVRGLVFGHKSCLAYRILVPQAGIEPGPPAVWNLRKWKYFSILAWSIPQKEEPGRL